MKIITWNVNGLRAAIKNGFTEKLNQLNPDILCLQETKLQQEQIPKDFFNEREYYSYWNFAVKKGYSGTSILSKIKPKDVKIGIKNSDIDNEGRNIILEFEKFYLINAYVPNAQPELKRIEFRTYYEKEIYEYLKKLDKKKPIIYCGDLNVAHEEIDLKNPKINIGNPGFSYEERDMFTNLLDNNFVDVYRNFYPEKEEYTWWSYRSKAREKNIGWRIDYFVVSKRIIADIKDIVIHNEIFGSDHCPVELILK